ncbi:hypothetical protein [Bradyrhizobium sp. SZCCHNR1070]|uniref:hypothetical protein n=1 Tax=Bradyrhizobium sp. SZCCHNR1070 TaxID=3057361 RepID=UPI00291626AE|nr:hypothetical protein [Bradyrhizobium sp. SZCCHNR1070]
MRYVLSIFQTADGGPHWISILTFVGWLVTGALILSSLVINRNDRVRQGPWEFSETQQTELVAALKASPKGKIRIEYSSADQKRARDFALKLKAVFEQAGYDVWGYLGAFHQATGEPRTGLELNVAKGSPSDYVGAGIQKALQGAGFEALGTVGGETDTVVLYVGIKPSR